MLLLYVTGPAKIDHVTEVEKLMCSNKCLHTLLKQSAVTIYGEFLTNHAGRSYR